ncbi:hypothetical protein MRB53_013954 [Persea americana]|uniref:Uncharacterized protein n=1 Tax=Persea americana TaxID=3435 RepID=A0ACC2K9F3_PERAE|nr:hypothetical protein MRB53_013954 [Persea americana]
MNQQLLQVRGFGIFAPFRFLLFIGIFFLLLAEPVLSVSDDELFRTCVPKRCDIDGKGPNISFPFWIPGKHPPHCGYPGFQLTCNNQQQLILKLWPPDTSSVALSSSTAFGNNRKTAAAPPTRPAVFSDNGKSQILQRHLSFVTKESCSLHEKRTNILESPQIRFPTLSARGEAIATDLCSGDPQRLQNLGIHTQVLFLQ